jgi:hypothetical protein
MMKKRRFLKVNQVIKSILMTGILFCCIAVAFIIPASAQDASVVRATQVDGAAAKNGVALKEGDVIQRDDKVETKANSAVVLTWSNGSMVEIYPETSLTLKGISYEGDLKLEKTLLSLEKGRIFAKAQVPEHLLSHFEIIAGNVPVITQGAEFALKYEESEKKFTVWSLIGRVVVDMGVKRIRIEDGQQVVMKAGGTPEMPIPMPGKTRDALIKVSKRLGGSLLIEEETVSTGGPLKVKVGGVRNRRGDAPYNVKFKAIISGGSGKIKSIRWDFGDGESSMGKEAQHTFTQGIYLVVITAEDENGQKATAQITISAEESCAC